MAEPQVSTSHEQARIQQGAERVAERTVEGERRSFETGAKVAESGAKGAAQTIQAGVAAVRDVARTGAETTARATRSYTDGLRSSIEPFAMAQVEFNRMFDEFWRAAIGFSAFPTLRNTRPFGLGFSAAPLLGLPAADIRESADAYLLSLELPGMAADNLDLSVDGGQLIVCGHKAEDTEDATAAYRISERRFGRIERGFPLPPDADAARIDASYRDGVLKVRLPKTASAAGRRARIEVKAA